jgi:hypothetical protein
MRAIFMLLCFCANRLAAMLRPGPEQTLAGPFPQWTV